jgi:hypothetical protein
MSYEQLPEKIKKVIGLAYDLSLHAVFDCEPKSISRIIAKELNFTIEEYWPEHFTVPTPEPEPTGKD